jgi:hypothetical protein
MSNISLLAKEAPVSYSFPALPAGLGLFGIGYLTKVYRNEFWAFIAPRGRSLCARTTCMTCRIRLQPVFYGFTSQRRVGNIRINIRIFFLKSIQYSNNF